MSCCSACGKHACACGCNARAGTPLPIYNRPGLTSLAYRVGTYADFRATMQADLSDAALPALAGLRTREADDPAIALLDAWAVGADVLSFYQERIANEGYLRTATERRSVLELARLVDYRLRPGVAASVYLAYTVEQASPPVTIAAGARAQSIPAPGEKMQTFETAEPLDARHEWNALQPRLTRPQDISLDNVAALDTLWVASAATNFKPNDRLLFVFGDLAKGGVPAIRLVESVEAQPQNSRSKVVLQPFDSATVQIVTAANAALPALSGDELLVLEKTRNDLLRGANNGGSPDGFLSNFQAVTPFVHGSPAAQAFWQAVQQAFTGAGTDGGSPATGFHALFGALSLAPTLQPANRLRLLQNSAIALGTPSDARPQLLLNFAPQLLDSFYRAWTSAPQGNPSPTLSGVFAMRLAVAQFGYNAPQPTKLIDDGHGNYHAESGPDWRWVPNSNRLYLDNAYDGIQSGSYVIVATPAQNAAPATHDVRKVDSVAIHPLTLFGISGKTTELGLVGEAADSNNAVAMIDLTAPITYSVRVQQVYVQSEALPLAELVIPDTIGTAPTNDNTVRITTDDATHLTLDSAVDGLKPGRWVIVQGQRADVPGTDAVNAAELVMIAAVEQGADANLPGDTVHSTLVFANDGLAYAYRRDTVTVCANVVRATHGESRNEVLGSGSGATAMQAFVLKQSPLTYVSATTVDGVQSTLTVRVNGMQWHETRNLAFVGATDRSFATAIDDAGKTTVQFGDGMHGARLPTGVENVVASYRNGIGTPGNVNAQQISLLATKPLGVKAVVNPLRASGGADAETRDQARGNVPLAVLALDRLVSITDYADFARSFGGVGKAAAVKLGNRVQVTIASAADAPIDASSDLYRNLLQALQRYGDPGLPVQLNVRELLALTLSAKVGLAPDYTWESVEPQLRAALLDRFGFERRALAQNAYLSEVVACLQAVRGVAWVDVDAFDQADKQRILDGLGGGNGNGKGSELTLSHQAIGQQAWPALRPYVQALPARFDSDGISVLPAQLACLLPDVPDTLLLQEATP